MAKRTTAGKRAGIAGAWSKARETTKADTGDFVPVEVGSYVMQLVGVEVGDYGDRRKMRLRWCVVGDSEFAGSVCNEFEGVDDEDRLIWIQRKLVSLGVDLDELEINSEEDLLAAFQELVDNYVCAKVRVTEKDGYINMKVLKACEVDESDLVDPADAIAGKLAEAPDTEEEAEEAEEEAEEAEEEAEDGEEEAEDGEEEREYEYCEGDRVIVDFEGRELEATVISGGDEQVEVEYDEDGCTEVVDAADRILRMIDDEDGEEAESEEEAEEAEEANELAAGDRVVVTIKGKEKAGEVASVNAEKGTCRVKLDGGATVTVNQDEIDFEVAE